MGGFIIRGLERVYKTVKPLWRLVNLERPTGFSPWTLYRDLCCRGGNINTHEKLIRSGCQSCRHDALRSLHVLSSDAFGDLTP